MTLSASCHCGAVQLAAATKPATLTQCTCSICRRYGAQWAYYKQKDVQVTCDAEAVSAYAWGDKSIEFFHCRNCGCMTHYESMKKGDDGRIAVNARMMELEDVASIRLRTFDGASTWKFLD